ncbi:MAG: rRNA maturation RNase YbeY [Chlorobiales bacterium]|jgi:probable rRNA maturation factor|nr:rRNA maturation RNase YbeY [Chlorobiales bacterium]
MCIVVSKTVKRLIPNRKIVKAIETVLHGEKHHCLSISAVYCGDKLIRKINKDYLEHDYETDTISFRYNSGKTVDGEFYISVDTIIRNARQYGVGFEDELLRVTIHSVLHLVGYDDHTSDQRNRMTEKENLYLSRIS